MEMMMMMMMTMFYICADLTSLLPLLPSSALKELTVIECGIKSLPANLFHFQLEEIDISGNSGKEKNAMIRMIMMMMIMMIQKMMILSFLQT